MLLKTLTATTALAGLMSLAAPESHAWGQTGHRVTGAIAAHYLSAESRAALERLLGPETLAEASTWADEMRSKQTPFWQEEAGPYHYVTVPDGKRYEDVGPPPEGDALTALARFRETLLSATASREDRQLALRFAIHIIGDLHQPLHVGNGTDRGGNDVELDFFWDDSNLHRVWDSGMIGKEGLSYSEWTAWLTAKITDQDLDAWSTPDPMVWVRESAEIRPEVYPESDDLSWQYKFQHIKTVKQRLSRAGVRMAAWLNTVFAEAG
ncbi:S1/P1 nuclease [Yunchengibacter salinarum]|uniref:S1/P1 nuclease n=1 Tax=Yunchengibacter salinarum TaxID=3133399 RepID=UPI0035B6155B